MTTHGYDRRVQRTRGLLHEALASLIHERPYEDIVVKEILARADVGRSTFYAHFRDKEDLLESSIRDVLEEGKAVSPSRNRDFADDVLERTLHLFEHVERHHIASDTATATRRQALVHEYLYRELVRSVADDIASPQDTRRELPSDLIAQFVASTFLVVLEWWLESEPCLSARQANDYLAALIRAAFSARR